MSVLLAWLVGTLVALAAPRDEAMEALADGRDAAAVAILEEAARTDPDLRCLLARVEQARGRPERALASLAELDPAAACAAEAAWIRAQALLVLGRAAEASALVEAAGVELVGEDRGHITAERLLAFADRLETRDPVNAGQVAGVLTLVLDLELDEARALEVARRLADFAAAHRLSTQAPRPFLARAVGLPEDESDRIRLARMLDVESGLVLLDPLPASPAVLSARLFLLRDKAPWRSLDAVRTLVGRWPDAPETREARRALGLRLAQEGWPVEAWELLEPVAAGYDEAAAEAAWALLRLLVDAGETERALALAADFVTRFPRSAQREAAEEVRVELLLRAAREAVARGEAERALSRFDELVAAEPRDPRAADAAVEAAALAADRVDRLETVRARWPGTPGAARALRELFLTREDPEQALAWLETLADDADAASLLDEVQEEYLAIEAHSTTARPARVKVQSRNVASVEVRLHRIGPRAWLAAGQDIDALPDLDVEVIAPDRRWTAAVPGAVRYREIDWELPVPVPGPGLYAVTVGTATQSARALLLVSDTRMVARRLGPDLVVAVFRGESPAAGARVAVRGATGITDGLTDRSGLFRVVAPGDALTVVAETEGGPAFSRLDAVAGEPAGPEPALTVDLDRPVYRPGDRLGFRIATTWEGPEPWTIWLDRGGPTVRHTVSGALAGELVVPARPTGGWGRGAAEELARLMAEVPWSPEPVELARVRIADEVPQGRSLRVDCEGERAVVEVREADGRPVPDVLLHWSWLEGGQDGESRADAAGRLVLAGPPEGVPWTLRVRLAGTSVEARGERRTRRATPPMLDLAQDRFGPGEPVRFDARGRLVVVRERQVASTPDPPRSWAPEEGFALDADWEVEPDPSVHETIRTLDLPEAGGVDLGALPLGRYRVIAWTDAGHAEERFDVTAGRVLGPVEAAAGVSVAAVERAALVTLVAGTERHAALLWPGQVLEVPVGPRWPSAVQVTGLDALGNLHERYVAVDTKPRVELAVEDDGPDWVVRARVTDVAGRPVAAQVVLRAVDPVLESWAGGVASSTAGPLATTGWLTSVSGAFRGLRHGARAWPVAAALLEEARILAERRLARRAVEGRLSDNALRDLLVTDVPLGDGMMALGAYGSGGGGGDGYASDVGLGTLGGDALILGSRGERPQPGARDRALWAVLDTDAAGEVQVVVPRPAGRVRWRVEAVALRQGVVGFASREVRTDERPALLVAAPGPAPEGASVEAEARVVNGGTGSRRLVASWEGAETVLELEGGQSAQLRLGTRRAGEAVELTLRWDGGEERRWWSWPLDRWTVEGRGVGPVAATPGEVALARDPFATTERMHAAVAVRAALAALPHLDPEERQAALDRVEALLDVLRPGAADAVAERAQVIAALAEAGRVLDVVADLGEPWAQLDLTLASAEDRVALVHACALAGLPVPDATLARLLREAGSLDAEARSQLARALGLLGRAEDARALVEGDGPQAQLARREAGGRERGVPTTTVPAPGDPARVAWLAAWTPPRRGPAPPLAALPQVVDAGVAPEAARLPVAGDGLPVRVSVDAGSTCSPCRLAPGEAALVLAPRDGLVVPGGLALLPEDDAGGLRLAALVPGTWTAHGRGWKGEPWSLVVEVGEGVSPVGEAAALALWRDAVDTQRDAEPWRAGRPRLEDWAPSLRGEVATLRFREALVSGEGLVEAFEDLRDMRPGWSLTVEQVATVARAYRAERPERAVALWCAAIGTTFADEAREIARLEPLVGPLATIQVTREVAARHPAVPVVEEVLFAQPERLVAMAEDGLAAEVREQGVTPTDVRLMAAAWNRDFVLLYPDSAWAPVAGLRLAAGLHALGAHARAAQWAARVRATWPEHPLADRLLFVEGLAAGAEGDARTARRALVPVVREPFMREDGAREWSGLREEAALALARLAEAEGDLHGAAREYAAVEGRFDEAGASVAVLDRHALQAEGFVETEGGRAPRLSFRVAGADRIDLRAYALDLRTLFLRDGGLDRVLELPVAGIAPAWEGSQRVKESPFLRPVELTLPLAGHGAWLVQAEAGGQTATMLVWRTDLALDVADAGDLRRVTVRRGGRPAVGVEVRAVGPGVVATRTDARGVALVPAFAPVLVFEGDDVDFTLPGESGPRVTRAGDELEETLQAELHRLRAQGSDLPPGGSLAISEL